MIKCRNRCLRCSLSVIRFKRRLLLPLLVFVAITGSFFVEVDSIKDRERAGQVKVQLPRDELQAPAQSVGPQPQPQPQSQQQTLPPTMTTSDISNTYKINSNTNTETVKIGNSKTKNYNFQESNYLPTQLTQVVLNVPKTQSRVLRKSRPPTVDEFMIKRKILDVYEEAGRELSGALGGDEEDSSSGNGIKAPNGQQSLHFNQLGRILQALNPKYIATERVSDAAFADPADPTAPVPPPEIPPQLLPLELSLDNETDEGARMAQASNLLAELEDRFRSQVNWDQSYMETLAGLADEQLQPTQLAFKRLLLCLNDPNGCDDNNQQYQFAGSSSIMGDMLGDSNQQGGETFEEDQPGLVYAGNDPEELYEESPRYDRQIPTSNLENGFNDNYAQYAPPLPQPQLGSMEPPRFRVPPPPRYDTQSNRVQSPFAHPAPIGLANARSPSGGKPPSMTYSNRPDTFRNRYQFQVQPTLQRYAYQRQPPQRRQNFGHSPY